jgi:hypothetical protein
MLKVPHRREAKTPQECLQMGRAGIRRRQNRRSGAGYVSILPRLFWDDGCVVIQFANSSWLDAMVSSHFG